MLIRSTRRAGLLGAVAAAAVLPLAAAPALAQQPGEAAQPATPAPGAPRVVISARDLRMNLVGVIPLRIGCFGTSGGCGGRLEARLAEPIVARASKGASAPMRTYAPFTLGRGGFGVSAGRSQLIRMRLLPRAAYLVRLAGTIPVSITAQSGSRTFEQTIAVYVSPLQKFR